MQFNFTIENATKICTGNGTWWVDPETLQERTDYSKCLSKDALQRLKVKFNILFNKLHGYSMFNANLNASLKKGRQLIFRSIVSHKNKKQYGKKLNDEKPKKSYTENYTLHIMKSTPKKGKKSYAQSREIYQCSK